MSAISESKIISTIRNLSLGRNEIQFGIIAATVMLSLVASYWGSMEILVLLIAAVIGIPISDFDSVWPSVVNGWYGCAGCRPKQVEDAY